MIDRVSRSTIDLPKPRVNMSLKSGDIKPQAQACRRRRIQPNAQEITYEGRTFPTDEKGLARLGHRKAQKRGFNDKKRAKRRELKAAGDPATLAWYKAKADSRRLERAEEQARAQLASDEVEPSDSAASNGRESSHSEYEQSEQSDTSDEDAIPLAKRVKRKRLQGTAAQSTVAPLHHSLLTASTGHEEAPMRPQLLPEHLQLGSITTAQAQEAATHSKCNERQVPESSDREASLASGVHRSSLEAVEDVQPAGSPALGQSTPMVGSRRSTPVLGTKAAVKTLPSTSMGSNPSARVVIDLDDDVPIKPEKIVPSTRKPAVILTEDDTPVKQELACNQEQQKLSSAVSDATPRRAADAVMDAVDQQELELELEMLNYEKQALAVQKKEVALKLKLHRLRRSL